MLRGGHSLPAASASRAKIGYPDRKELALTYALLIYRNVSAGEALPSPQEHLVLERHRELQTASSRRNQLHAVARLDDASRARTVRRHGNAHEVTDGPYVETKEWLVGFYLLDCATEDEALERASSICDSNHAIEVRPVGWRWRP
jgi:hypothetical protein